MYRWEGAIERSEEALLLVKTSDGSLPQLSARLAELHPYDVPEIVALDVASVNAAYGTWVDEATRATGRR